MAEVTQEFLNTPIAELESYGLSLRVVNELEEHRGIMFVYQLQEYTEAEILKIPNFATVALKELKRVLAELNRQLLLERKAKYNDAI